MKGGWFQHVLGGRGGEGVQCGVGFTGVSVLGEITSGQPSIVRHQLGGQYDKMGGLSIKKGEGD